MPDYDFEPPFEVGFPENPADVVPYDPSADPYESGYLGGNSAGDPATSTDWASAGIDVSKLPAGAMDVIKQLASALGLVKNGAIDLASLLPMLALFAGGALGADTSRTASHELQDAAREASKQATGLIGEGGPTGGGARANYQPFIAAGQPALEAMVAQIKNPSNLAAQFVSKGAPSDLATKFGSVNLRALAKR